jgi:inner membrane protein involved in colicin E2 resistance
MVRRIAAIVFIFVCTTVAWAILGATIFARSESAGSHLQGRVASNWGSPQTQVPPAATYVNTTTREEEVIENGKKLTRTITQNSEIALPVEASQIDVALNLDYRQKGLMWYSTYAVHFNGQYTFRNPTDVARPVTFKIRFPAANVIYDDLLVSVNGKPLPITTGADGATATAQLAASESAVLALAYRSQGLGSWTYKFGNEVSQVRDFVLNMKTNFKDIDFPEDTLSPTEKRETGQGWDLTWRYKSLLSGLQIGMDMPEKLQPGPLAGQISFFAPVSLFFFFFLMFIITTLRNIELHPMNYFFLATAFFAFHLLLAYLVDHISIHAAFVVCSIVSVFLVVTYLRLVVGMRFAAVEAGGAQLIYLVLFSYAFFFKGFTGLAITIGSIITLFVVMQMTGRIRWAEKFAAASR